MSTSFSLRIQAIRSQGQNPRLYVNFPLAPAAAIGLEPGEEVQWELLARGELHLVRPHTPAPAAQSKARKQARLPIIRARFAPDPPNWPLINPTHLTFSPIPTAFQSLGDRI